jgi:hypothetical protein
MQHTFRQFQDKLIRDCAQKNKCTLKEAAYCFPDHIVRSRHGEECFRAAQNNIILSLDVLDSLTHLQRYRIFHDLPDYLSWWIARTGKPYINPESRKENSKYFGFKYSKRMER